MQVSLRSVSFGRCFMPGVDEARALAKRIITKRLKRELSRSGGAHVAQHRMARALNRPGAPTARPQQKISSSEPDAIRARSFLARLDLEVDALATRQRIEVDARVQAASVEEVLLSILGRDEAEATVGDQLLDGPSRHPPTPLLES